MWPYLQYLLQDNTSLLLFIETLTITINNSYLKIAGCRVPGGAGVERILERHGRTLGFLDGQHDQVLLLQEVKDNNHQTWNIKVEYVVKDIKTAVWILHNCHNLRQCATSPKGKQIWMWDTNNARHQLTVLWCVQFICFTKWYKITWTCVSRQLRNEAADFIVAAAIECYRSVHCCCCWLNSCHNRLHYNNIL